MKKNYFYGVILLLSSQTMIQSGGGASRPAPAQPAPAQPAPAQPAPAQQEVTPLPTTATARTEGDLTIPAQEATQDAPTASTKPVVPKGTITCHFEDPKNIRPTFSTLNDKALLKAFDKSFHHSNIWFINASYDQMKAAIEDTAFTKAKIAELPYEKKSFAQAKAEGRLAEFESYEWLIVKKLHYGGKNEFMADPGLLVLVDFNQINPNE